MAGGVSTYVMKPQAALKWWNAFNPQRQLFPGVSPVGEMHRFDEGPMPDQALSRIVDSQWPQGTALWGHVEMPADFVLPVDAAVDREPPVAQVVQAFIESGSQFTDHRSGGDAFRYQCSALRAGQVAYQYDGAIAVSPKNYEKLLGRYQVLVDQIVNIYVNKCWGRFRDAFNAAALNGVLNAITTYDALKGRFPSWLIQCVHIAINDITSEVLGVSQTMIEVHHIVRNTKRRFRQTYNRDAQLEELRFVLGVTEQVFRTMLGHERTVRNAYRGLPFDETYMGVSTSREAFAVIGNGEESCRRARDAFEGAKGLTEPQRYAVQRFYFDSDESSMRAIGEEERVTGAAIGSRMDRAMEWLERFVPGIERDFDTIRPRAKRDEKARARTAAKKQKKGKWLRMTSLRKFVAETLEPGCSSTTNVFRGAVHRDGLWDLSFQERRVLQHRLEGNTSGDIAELEGNAITSEEAGQIFRTAFGKLSAHRMRHNNPPVTNEDVIRAVKGIDALILMSEHITDGESSTYFSERPEESQILLSLVTDKQRRAIELHLDGLNLSEMGAEMGDVTMQVARVHLVRGRDGVRRYLRIATVLRTNGVAITTENLLSHEISVTISNHITGDRNPDYIHGCEKEFRQLMSALTDKQKMAIELRLNGLLYSEIGERMGGISKEAVCRHINVGMDLLREYLSIVAFLNSRGVEVARENILAYAFNVELSNCITDDDDPHFAYSDEFQDLFSDLLEDQQDALRYRQFTNRELATTMSINLIKRRVALAKAHLKKAYATRHREAA